MQRKLYKAFLNSELVHLALQPKASPLAAITVRISLFFIMMLFTLCLWGWGVACSLIEKLAVACLLMRLCLLHCFTLFSPTDIEENL
jgi:hypothetical protein